MCKMIEGGIMGKPQDQQQYEKNKKRIQTILPPSPSDIISPENTIVIRLIWLEYYTHITSKYTKKPHYRKMITC
jgi:hypothetical protein